MHLEPKARGVTMSEDEKRAFCEKALSCQEIFRGQQHFERWMRSQEEMCQLVKYFSPQEWLDLRDTLMLVKVFDVRSDPVWGPIVKGLREKAASKSKPRRSNRNRASRK